MRCNWLRCRHFVGNKAILMGFCFSCELQPVGGHRHWVLGKMVTNFPRKRSTNPSPPVPASRNVSRRPKNHEPFLVFWAIKMQPLENKTKQEKTTEIQSTITKAPQSWLGRFHCSWRHTIINSNCYWPMRETMPSIRRFVWNQDDNFACFSVFLSFSTRPRPWTFFVAFDFVGRNIALPRFVVDWKRLSSINLDRSLDVIEAFTSQGIHQDRTPFSESAFFCRKISSAMDNGRQTLSTQFIRLEPTFATKSLSQFECYFVGWIWQK